MPAAAAAIETTTFGLDVVEPTPDGRLHITLEAGERSTGRLRLFNKTDGPLAIKLSVSPATVDAAGTAQLGGDATAVEWVEVPAEPVALAPRQQQVVEVVVDAPDELPAERATVAIVAEPAAVAGGQAPAVLQRVAVTTLLEPGQKKGVIASLGWWPWVALALLVAVAAWTVRRTSRRRD